MPIKPENRAKYPPDWKAIRAEVLARAGNRCEECGVSNYELGLRDLTGKWWPWTDFEEGRVPADVDFERVGQAERKAYKIVLTIAHLGLPIGFPVDIHVTRSADRDEVFNIIGLLMPPPPERPEWNDVVYDWAITQLIASPTASRTPFAVALPYCKSGAMPRGAISHQALPVPPEAVLLSDWSLLREPFDAARVATEAASIFGIEPADIVDAAASLTLKLPQPTLNRAVVFAATGKGTSFLSLTSLTRCHGENDFADYASVMGRASSFRGHNSVIYQLHDDHNPANNGTPGSRPNLKALCQYHHLKYDHQHHMANARATRAAKKGMVDMFQPQPLTVRHTSRLVYQGPQ